VCEVIAEHKDELVERRYSFPVGKLLGAVRESLKWADGKLVKLITEKQVIGYDGQSECFIWDGGGVYVLENSTPSTEIRCLWYLRALVVGSLNLLLAMCISVPAHNNYGLALYCEVKI
jgi:hypothetical protein